jgi:hypothetical protein
MKSKRKGMTKLVAEKEINIASRRQILIEFSNCHRRIIATLNSKPSGKKSALGH